MPKHVKFPSYLKKILDLIQPHWNVILVVLSSVTFSTILMFATFSYKDQTIVMGSKIWSDFWANIPLIRSFSLGDNIPPEYPLFPGERIRYHFLFFFLVGMLERLGVRIDFAINFLSIIGFSGMMIGIYALTKHLSKSKLAGWLAIILFIFNSSFSWIYYLDKGIDTFPEIISNKDYATFGPYDNKVISAFWNLNIYINQRHFAFALAILFISIWSIVYTKKKKWPLVGVILLISLSWLHKVVLLIALLILGALFLTHSKKRKTILGALLLAGSLSVPGILYLNGDGVTTEKAISFQPGFLYQATDWHEFSFKLSGTYKWLVYWFLNLGILPFTALFGWLILNFQQVKKKDKVVKKITHFLFSDHTVYLVLGIVVFAVANTLSFSRDLGTNHKFINFSQLIFIAFSAGFLASLWHIKILPLSKLNTSHQNGFFKNLMLESLFEIKNAFRILGIALAPLCFILLTLGGIFDFFPIFNDYKNTWDDVGKDPVAQWIVVNTPPDSVFFNTSYGYNSVTIAGRKVFWGWDYFIMGLGYNLSARREGMKPILSGIQSKNEICAYFRDNRIHYMLLDLNDKDRFLDVLVNKRYLQDQFSDGIINFDHVGIIDMKKGCMGFL